MLPPRPEWTPIPGRAAVAAGDGARGAGRRRDRID